MSSIFLPLSDILPLLWVGVSLAFVYLWLLLKTVQKLPIIKRKGLFLLASAVGRIVLFLGIALLFSQHSPTRFIWIVLAFVLTRFLVVGHTKSGGGK